MTLVETYRGYGIFQTVKNGREMFKTGGTFTFSLQSAREAVNKSIYSYGFGGKTFVINPVANISFYRGVQVYSLGEYYDSVRSIQQPRKGMKPHRMQVI